MLGCARRASAPTLATQHREVERLGQVVIGAEPQPVDSGPRSRRAGQHQHPATAAGATNLAHTSSPCTREVAIEQDHLVIVHQCMRQAGLAIQRDIDCHPRLRKPAATVSANSWSSSINKYPHRRSPFRSR